MVAPGQEPGLPVGDHGEEGGRGGESLLPAFDPFQEEGVSLLALRGVVAEELQPVQIGRREGLGVAGALKEREKFPPEREAPLKGRVSREGEAQELFPLTPGGIRGGEGGGLVGVEECVLR